MATSSSTQPTTSSHASEPCGMGEFCWFECNSRNQPAAEKFYSTLVSGTAMASPESPFPYTILSCGGHPMMGMMEMDATFPSDVPAHWMGYIAVADLDAACVNVPALGGTVCVAPTDIQTGRFSVITDPTGAVVSLFQSHECKTDGVNWFGPGLVGWNELMSSDPKVAADFYCKLLGWTPTETNTLGFPYWMFSSNGRTVGGMMAKRAEDKSPRSYWLQYVQTLDLDASVALAKSLGGTALCDSMDIPGIGRTAYFTDPNGAPFALWQPPKARGCCSSGGCGCG